MKLTYKNINSRFKLNGIPFSKPELREVSYSLIKEGEEYEQVIGDFLLNWLDGSAHVTVNTSGSTGRPKRIVLEKEHMVNSAIATGEYFGLKEGDTTLHCLSSDSIAGKMMLVRAMVLGLELDYVEPSSNPLTYISKAYDFAAMVPLQLKGSINNIDQIKILLVGGALISDSLKKQVQDKSTQVFETYGMTETITHIAIKKINHKNNNGSALSSQQLPSETEVPVTSTDETSFRTLANVTVAKDDRGCLVIEAPSITKAPIVTNDLVNIISDTEFEWLGRFDTVINSGGMKLIPEQIEVKLSPILDSRYFVAGFSDSTLGQKLVMIVEGETDATKLKQQMKSLKTLSKFEVPKEIYCINKFVETKNGKVQRDKTLKQILDSVI